MNRYSPHLPWRPLVSPPSVDDRDACAIYASVRKDATPSREPVKLALANLQKMLHRAGNVDGEGDGCGMLVDIPRRIWAEEVRAGGHNPALANDPAFAVGHVFIERSADVEAALHGARELLGRAGLRILAERLGAVEPQALGATAREEEPHFWQVGGLLASADDRHRALFALARELESRAGLPRALVLGRDLRLQGDGRPEGARGLLPGPRRRPLRDGRLLRSQPLLDQHLAVVPPRAAVLGARPQRRDQHDRAVAPGGPCARRRHPRRRLGLDGPKPDDRPPGPGRGPEPRRGHGADRAPGGERDPVASGRPAPVLHVPARGDGPVRPGPRGADRPPRRRVRVLRRRAGAAAAVAAGDARRPHLQLRARRRLGRRDGLRAAAAGPGGEADGLDRRRQATCPPLGARRDAARGRPPLARSHRRRRRGSVRPGAAHRRTAAGHRHPRVHRGRAGGARQGFGPGPVRLRLAARRRQARPADGLKRRRADRLARLRRAAGRAEPRAPEPRRLLQGDGRRGHQPGDRPRARDGALLDPRGVRPAAVAARPGRRHGHGRDLVPRDPRRPPRPRAALGLHLPRDRPQAPDLADGGPLGAVSRTRRGDRHGAARIREHRRGDRADQAGGGAPGSRRHGASRAHRSHGLRRRAPLPRRPSGDLGGRPGAEELPGRAGCREPAAPLLDRAPLGGAAQRPRRRPRARPRGQRRQPVRDARGRLRRRLRAGRLQRAAPRSRRGSRR